MCRVQPSRPTVQDNTVPGSDEEDAQQQKQGGGLANGHNEANGHDDAADGDDDDDEEEEEEEEAPPPLKQRKLQKSQAPSSQAPAGSQRGRGRAAQLPLRAFPKVSF